MTTHPGAALIYFTDAANYEEMESVTRYLREYTRINLKPYLVVDWANTKKNSNDPVFIWLKKAQEKGSQYYEPNRSFVGPSPHSIGIYFSGQMARQPYDKLFLADLFS